MSDTAIATTLPPAEVLERLIIHGDLSKLSASEKTQYYLRVCEALDLNAATQPFAYLTLNGKQVLYARKECTEQLRKKHNVSVKIVARETVEGCYVVTASATLPSGRTDESIGAVPIDGVKGEQRANAMMKAETKSKRRVTLSICGLGMLDESEVESIPQAVSEPARPATISAAQQSELSRLLDAAGRSWEKARDWLKLPMTATLADLAEAQYRRLKSACEKATKAKPTQQGDADESPITEKVGA